METADSLQQCAAAIGGGTEMKFVLSVILSCLVFGACSGPGEIQREKKTLSIKGSDSMLPLVERLAEQFMLRHPGISISTEGGGSTIGIRSLIDHEVDICATSRPLTADEVRQLASRFQSLGISVPVAKDALAIIVHPSNSIRSLSLRAIKEIFTGTLSHWSAVGGDDRPITVVRREENSGSHMFVEEHLMSGESFTEQSKHVTGPAAAIDAVQSDTSAISYSPYAYARNVRIVPVDDIPLTLETVRNGSYPVTRYVYFYVVSPPEGLTKQFTDWVVSKEGQAVVRQNGFIPLFHWE